MATIRKFEDLEIWQLARDICRQIKTYVEKEKFLKDFTLKDQIKRSSGSSMDNIAEGFEREGNKEFVNFLTMSKGSAGEVRSQLIRAFDRNYIDEEVFSFLKSETISLSKKLSGFINYLKNSEHKGNKFNRKND